MPVVINDFEVIPEPPAQNQSAANSDKKGSKKPEMSDYELKQMLERRLERLERVSAH
jgi:hypothetical protein